MDRRLFLASGGATFLTLATAPAYALSPASNLPRSLSFENLHTGERLKTTYWEDGGLVGESLKDIAHVLRDHRTNEDHAIDLTLLDTLCALNLTTENHRSLQVISGYRSPATNAKLHANSDGVAVRSLHMVGQAIDIRIQGMPTKSLYNAARSLKAGGVGYYPDSQFVHVDVGRVRYW